MPATTRLKQLRLYNFRSFRGEHELDLPESGLVLVSGENRDTRGDSGAGKTNVLLAVAYLFGYCRHRAAALQCWGDEDPMYVQGLLSTASGYFVVTRSAKGLVLTKGKEKVKGRAAEELLDRVCGVPAALREALTYRDQVRPRKFLEAPDADKKKFLVNVLPELAQAEADVAKRSREVSDLEDQLQRLRAVEASVVVPEVLALALEPLDPALDKLKETAARLADTDAELKLAKDEHEKTWVLVKAAQEDALYHPEVVAANEKVAKCERLLKDLEAADLRAASDYEAQTAALYDSIVPRTVADVKGQLASREANAVRGKMAKLKEAKCPECGRSWDDALLVLSQNLATLESLDIEIAQGDRARAEAAKMKAEADARRYQSDPRVAKMRTLLAKLKEAASAAYVEVEFKTTGAVENKRACATERLNLAEKAQMEARFEHKLAANALSEVKNRNKLVAHEHEVRREYADKERRRLEEARAAADACEAEFKREADYLELVRGFRNKYFDELLASVAAEANEVLSHLPNAAHVTVEFKTERQNRSGTVEERITPVTYVAGVQRELDESVSGGQLTSVSLGVDLAVARVVSQRLGCSLGWVVLDEAFNGHDFVTKQGCLEMLQAYAADKLVVMVDHHSELKEMFNKVVVVVHENGDSRLRAEGI